MSVPVRQLKKIIIALVLCACSVSAADEDLVRARMKIITVPEVDFRDARLEDVLYSMIESGRKYDPAKGESAIGINLVLSLTPEQREKKLNLSARNVSFYDLLNAVSKSSGVGYQLTGSVVMFGGTDAAGDSLRISRTYGIPLTISNDVRKQGAKKFLEELGVRFPEGASATYIPATGKMMVVNSPENIRFMEKILRGMGVIIKE